MYSFKGQNINQWFFLDNMLRSYYSIYNLFINNIYLSNISFLYFRNRFGLLLKLLLFIKLNKITSNYYLKNLILIWKKKCNNSEKNQE